MRASSETPRLAGHEAGAGASASEGVAPVADTAFVMAAGGTDSPGGQDASGASSAGPSHARADDAPADAGDSSEKACGKGARPALKKVLGGILAALIALVMLVVIGFVAYMRIAYAPFYGEATASFDTPGIGSGFIPQDLDYLEGSDQWLFSGYEGDGKPSPVWKRDAAGNVERIQVEDPDGGTYDGHGSGITSAYGNVYLTTEGGFLVLSADEVAAASDGDVVKACSKVDVGFDPAFLNVQDDVLYTGVFYLPGPYDTPEEMHLTAPDGTENHAVMYAYPRDGSAEGGFADVPAAVYSIPDKVQGVALAPDGRVVFSTSWGFSPSVLYVYDAGILPQQGAYDVAGEEVELYFCAGEGLLRTVEAPPMMEGIDQFDGRLFLSNESASNKYLFGKLYGAGAVYWIEV